MGLRTALDDRAPRENMNGHDLMTNMKERPVVHPVSPANPDSRLVRTSQEPARLIVHGAGQQAATVLGQSPLRIPTAGKIRPGIKVLTRKAAEQPAAVELYEYGLSAGQSFDQIEQALAKALPQLKNPLVPRNVQWFTVRPQDFGNPDLARQLMDAYGEDRGEGRHLYRFPVIFPSDHWSSVIPHELAAWSTHEKRYWSEYSSDGSVRHCKCFAPVPRHEGSHRTVRLFGGRKTMLREANDGLCEPENCPEYQARECNLTGRFVFFIPGIRSVSAFELHTNSFYAMNAAIQTFRTIAFLRGGRISGFLDRKKTPFYLSKKLTEVSRIDDDGRAVRVPQWIIELEAPVDIAALLRCTEAHEASDGVVTDAALSAQILDPVVQHPPEAGHDQRYEIDEVDAPSPVDLEPSSPGSSSSPPTLQQILQRAQAYGIAADHFEAYAKRRWSAGWKLNPQGRSRAWSELERHRNDPVGYADKVAHEWQDPQPQVVQRVRAEPKPVA